MYVDVNTNTEKKVKSGGESFNAAAIKLSAGFFSYEHTRLYNTKIAGTGDKGSP